MDLECGVIRIAADPVGDPLAIIDGRALVEMIDAFVIDHLFVAEEQIEEIVLHLKPRRPRAAGDVRPLDAGADNTIASERRLNWMFSLRSFWQVSFTHIDARRIPAVFF